MRGHRHGRITLAALAATGTLLAGCSAGSSDSGKTSANGASGGTIRVGVVNLPPGQGNPYTAIGAPSIYTWSAIFDPLTMVDAKGTPQPHLAESWKNTSPTTWQFTLRKNVTFSDGEKLDAAAVKATVDYLTSEAGKTSVVGSELKMLAGAKVVDDQTVEISTSTADAILPSKLTSMYIVAPDAWKKSGPDGFAAKPVGTGPFTADSFDQSKITLSANAKSWRAPKAAKMEVVKLAESAPRLQALQSKQIDLAIALSPDQAPQAEQSGAKMQISPAPQVSAFAFVQSKSNSPVADKRVRQAMNYAVDKKAIADNLLGGLGKPATQGATPETFGYDPEIKGYEYSPAKAKQLLADAGYADGITLNATVTVGSFPADSEIYQSTADYLSKVGITLKLNTVPFAEWLEKYQANTWPGDMFNQSWNVAPIGDAIRPASIFSCAKVNPFFCDQEATPLIQQINTEFDSTKREALLKQLAKHNFDTAPSLLLVEQVDVNATSANVGGYAAQNRFISYEKMTVK